MVVNAKQINKKVYFVFSRLTTGLIVATFMFQMALQTNQDDLLEKQIESEKALSVLEDEISTLKVRDFSTIHNYELKVI